MVSLGDSVCNNCIFFKCIESKSHGVMDCDPPEYICEEDMYENFGTTGGCWLFQDIEEE